MSAVGWAVARAARSLPAQASHTGRVMNPGLRRCVGLFPLAHTLTSIHKHAFGVLSFLISSRVSSTSPGHKSPHPLHATARPSDSLGHGGPIVRTRRNATRSWPSVFSLCSRGVNSASWTEPARSAPLELAQCERAAHTTLCGALLLVRGTPLCESKAWPGVACFVDRVVANDATLLSLVELIHSSEDIVRVWLCGLSVAQCG
jgi:hypothetical protein